MRLVASVVQPIAAPDRRPPALRWRFAPARAAWQPAKPKTRRPLAHCPAQPGVAAS